LETKESVFSCPDSVEHINTFLTAEGARFTAIFGFFHGHRVATVELRPEFPMMSRMLQKGRQKRQQKCDF
jgi:hypothetical protein